MTIRVGEIKQRHLQLSDDGCTAHKRDDEHNRKDSDHQIEFLFA